MLFWVSAVSDMCHPQLRLQEDILKPSRMFNQRLKRHLTITADAFPRIKKKKKKSLLSARGNYEIEDKQALKEQKKRFPL